MKPGDVRHALAGVPKVGYHEGGYIYAVEFAGGLLKVGRAANPGARIGQHRARLAVAGLGPLQQHSAQCVGKADAAEARLIQRCSTACSERRADEWFVGLVFSDVCTWLEEEAARTHQEPIAYSKPSLWIRRDCYPFPSPGGYICRSCCRVHISEGSAFLCRACVERGYAFDGALSFQGAAVPLWTGIEPGTEARPFDGVSCEELRPEIPWMRIPDPAWRYGRPVIDYASALPKKPKIGQPGAPDVPEPAKAA